MAAEGRFLNFQTEEAAMDEEMEATVLKEMEQQEEDMGIEEEGEEAQGNMMQHVKEEMAVAMEEDEDAVSLGSGSGAWHVQ